LAFNNFSVGFLVTFSTFEISISSAITMRGDWDIKQRKPKITPIGTKDITRKEPKTSHQQNRRHFSEKTDKNVPKEHISIPDDGSKFVYFSHNLEDKLNLFNSPTRFTDFSVFSMRILLPGQPMYYFE
jgi:hypothetical protein